MTKIKKNKNKNKNNLISSKPVVRKSNQRNITRRSRPITEPFSFSNVGGSIGKFLGTAAGSILGRIFGSGAYTVEQNVLWDSIRQTPTLPPLFETTRDGSIIVCAREYVGEIKGSNTFTMQLSQPIAPTNKYLFPRLCTTASNYETYEMLGLIFEYVTTSGTAVGSADTSLGTVITATNYDVIDPAFATKQEMESYMFSVATVPCSSVLHPVECKPSLQTNKNRLMPDPSLYSPGAPSPSNSYPANTDRRLYEAGLFQVASVGQQTGTNGILGEIWVSYCFKLMVPRANTFTSVAHVESTGSSSSNPMGTSITLSSGSDYPVISNSLGFTLPEVGLFTIVMAWTNVTGTITSAPTINWGPNVTPQACFNNYTSTTVAPFSATTASLVTNVFVNTAGTTSLNNATLGGLAGMTAARTSLFVLRRNAITGDFTGF